MNDNTEIAGILPGTAGPWCIVRTSPGRTLRLMASLSDAGLEAWTPSQTLSWKRPRSNVTIEREVPIAPTFVFVRACHVRDLAEAEAMPINPHPSFSLFRHAGRIPLIGDSEVEGLRQEEQRGRDALARAREQALLKERRKKRRKLHMGQRVRFGEDSAFAGIAGTVEQGGDRFVLGSFGQGFRMKIATWLLSPDDIEQTQPAMGAAA